MAPSPNGDHSLGLDGLGAFLRFGPMLRALRGRVWNLTPGGVIASSSGGAAVECNIFDTPNGLLAVAVPRGGSGGGRDTVSVMVASSLRAGRPCVEVLHVGRNASWTAVKAGAGGAVKIPAPDLVAMIRYRTCKSEENPQISTPVPAAVPLARRCALEVQRLHAFFPNVVERRGVANPCLLSGSLPGSATP